MTETVVTVERAPGVTTTTTTTSSGGLSWMKFNLEYFKSVPGIIKIVQLILGILCFATATGTISASQFFLFVAVTSWICCLIWIIFYMFTIREAINPNLNWIFIEFVVTAVCALFFFIAFIVQLAVFSYVKAVPENVAGHETYSVKGRNIAAGVFGIFNFGAYCAGLFFLFLEHRRGTTM